jgi:predicted DNA-binding protein with PD1-like motif
MKYYALRLHPGQDVKNEITVFTKKQQIKAGIVLTCIGSLSSARLRLADENVTKKLEEKFEILSLQGTLSQDGCHLHISISDSEGSVIGGHLLDGCIIYTTAEIVIGEVDDLTFSREYDPQTGFDELKVE